MIYLKIFRWQGAAATITQDPESTVFGVIWELEQEHQETLDLQESVPRVYRRIKVKVYKINYYLGYVASWAASK